MAGSDAKQGGGAAGLEGRILAALGGAVGARETLQVAAIAVVRPQVLTGGQLGSLLGVFSMRNYWLATTGSRLFLIPLNRLGQAAGVAWDEPLRNVRLVRYRDGLLLTMLTIERRSDGEQLRFRVSRIFRARLRRLQEQLGPAG